MTKRRVVITGLGAVTPLGVGVGPTLEGLVAGTNAVRLITKFDASRHSTRFAAEVSGLVPEDYFDRLELKRYDVFTIFGLIAGDMAVADSGLDLDREDRNRVGCIMGTGIGGIFELESQKERFMEKGPSKVSPFFIPKLMSNAVAGQLAIRHGLGGTNFVTASACASSSHAIGMALRTIQWDEAEIMVAGGSEAGTTELGLAGFCAMKALSTRNDAPDKASRPFDRDRDGFVMGEGAAVLILEELEHARKRGARIYAEVIGFGSTDDAFHITAPREDGDGAARAMLQAVREGGVPAESYSYVNAHGTSTPLNDKIETIAIKRVFGSHAKRLAVSSSKSMFGHLLGASGAVGTLASAAAIHKKVVHPTINLDHPDPECDLDYVPHHARDLDVKYAIANSLGFGGHNTCIALGAI
jgi:3-oxoacyl-[acyl-carrier-protein] synthase II